MENNPIKLKFLTLLLLIVPIISTAQTQQWRLIWDQNQEDDISHYRVFRGNSANPTTPLTTVSYPDTVFTDDNLTPGSHYFYRITAVDTEELESDYSDNVDAAIPSVNIPNQVFNQGGNVQITLDNFVSDPGAEDHQITWSFSHSSHLQFDLDESRQLTISPSDSSLIEEVVFTATDEDEFYDKQRVWITVNDIPDIDELPDQLQQQGHPFSPIPLDDLVDDQDQADSSFIWEIGDTDSLQAELDDQNQLLVSHPDNFTEKPVEDQWYGVETILLKVSDYFGASDSMWVNFDGNAQPRLILEQIDSLEAEEPFSYPVRVTDQDSVEETTIEFVEYPTFLSVANRVLFGTFAVEHVGEHVIRVRATDSRGGMTEKTDTLLVVYNPDKPKVDLIDGQHILEGESFTEIPLNTYVTNIEEPDSLIWSATGNTELIIEIDAAGNALIDIPNINWFGQEQITFKATNSQGLSGQQSVLFMVEAVNDSPQISGLSGQKIYQNDHFDILDLNNIAIDVDDLPATLTWTITGNNNLDVVPLEAARFQVTPKVADWYGSESLVIQVSDPEGASDQLTVTYEIGKSIYSPFSTRFVNSGTIIEVTWDTDLSAIGTIQFGTNDFNRSSDPEPRQINSHSIILSGLDSHTEYQFRALSEDSSGYKHISGIHSFTTGLAGEVSVFPNPYRAGAHPENDVIHFANLPEGTTISIFNLLGEPIFSIQDQSDLFRWDGKNNQQKNVQSGLYIYLLKDADNKKVESGKIVIIR